MTLEIRCQHHNGDGSRCNRFLAEIDDQGRLWLFCPVCRTKHQVQISALVEAALRQAVAASQQAESGGFML